MSGPASLSSQLSFFCRSFTFMEQMKSAEMGHHCSQSMEDVRGIATNEAERRAERVSSRGGMNATVT